jgi:hypothetical protein
MITNRKNPPLFKKNAKSINFFSQSPQGPQRKKSYRIQATGLRIQVSGFRFQVSNEYLAISDQQRARVYFLGLLRYLLL